MKMESLVSRIRHVLSWLEANPEVRCHSLESTVEGTIELRAYCFNADEQRSVAAAFCRAAKGAKKVYNSTLATMIASVNGIAVKFLVDREAVCRRIQKQVTLPAEPERTIPAQPERTVTVDEWECGESLLASVPAESEASNGK